MHVIPDSVQDPAQRYLGSTKDAFGRTEYFISRDIDYVELFVKNRKDSDLRNQLTRYNLKEFSAVIIELPVYPKSIKFLKKKYPSLKVYVRAINAEFYHDWHYVYASLKYRHLRLAIKYGLLSVLRLYKDVVCARYADATLSITEWESRNYWQYIVNKRKLATVPYFVPSTYNSDIVLHSKEKLCVCLQSTIQNPFLEDAAVNFNDAINKLHYASPDWEFCITGAELDSDAPRTERLKATGLLESPFEILKRCRAVALLSDYGFGFKTKILEAIQHRCFVLVTAGLYQRLPGQIQRYCLVVDLSDPDSFEAALAKCLVEFPVVDVNALIREEAFNNLDALLTRCFSNSKQSKETTEC